MRRQADSCSEEDEHGIDCILSFTPHFRHMIDSVSIFIASDVAPAKSGKSRKPARHQEASSSSEEDERGIDSSSAFTPHFKNMTHSSVNLLLQPNPLSPASHASRCVIRKPAAAKKMSKVLIVFLHSSHIPDI